MRVTHGIRISHTCSKDVRTGTGCGCGRIGASSSSPDIPMREDAAADGNTARRPRGRTAGQNRAPPIGHGLVKHLKYINFYEN